MLSSLQPVKRASKAIDSKPPTSNNAAASAASRGHTSKKKPSARDTAAVSLERASKRQKLTSDSSTTDLATRQKRSGVRTSTPRSGQKPPSPNTTHPLPSQPPRTIDHYFTPSDSYQSDEREKPPDNLYDAIQKRVHEAETRSEDKRTLRSHDESSRVKSALSTYFPNYDEIINDAPKAQELLTPDTVFVIRSSSKKKSAHNNVSPTQKSHSRVHHPASPPTVHTGIQIVDFSIIEKSIDHLEEDPLTDEFYFKAHRRAERKEKQLRNIERERAMHEKAQLERLLDGLQGYDWLRVMGVTGVTDSEAQRFQSKRDYFIREVKALVQKFQEWREEEKRQRFDKAAPQGKAEQDADDEIDQDGQASREPSSSEIDASAARQLQQEASGSAKAKIRQRINAHVVPIVYRAPTPEGPFTSFFARPHLRDAALGKNRHGRVTLAFGQPMPEFDERTFALPIDYTSPQFLKEHARRRRRMKRESLADSTAKK
ncbi:hypothetical protein ANO11243_039920 [Dothideomycetidae sp. 11243]|nr:hypothetical protein ANO11243_039920 [fungal sp. No.11243]